MASALLQSAEWHSQSGDCLMAENIFLVEDVT